ncbi:MAG: hypothetical protein VKL39_21745 [Leptolyngbyaceae bacterium]|nr:hypothetical protein [Leptolyngbyaceae bacterium]
MEITFSQIADGGDLEPQNVGLITKFNKMSEVSKTTENPAIGNVLLVAGLMFTAKSLDGEQIEMSFSEISTKYPDDDVFYYNNGIGEPVACMLSSLSVVLS